MRINTNISSLATQRTLSQTESAVSKSMQKLSSGFRINRASDDAAGLGIANKLRAETRAMTQASRNAEQANSLLQISEGSVSSVQNILERMKELATQSASDNVDTNARLRINKEFTDLRTEITRTVQTTKFQGNTLIDGREHFWMDLVLLGVVVVGLVGFALNALLGALEKRLLSWRDRTIARY